MGSGDESTIGIGPHTRTLVEFWDWALSNVVDNTTRAVFAEYLVAVCLGLDGAPRVAWDAVDLRYGDRAIEVKAAGRGQTWSQAEPSRVRFGIDKKFGWDAPSNQRSTVAARAADIYVFCIHGSYPATVENVLDSNEWEFFVASTGQLAASFGDQKSVSESSLRKIIAPVTAGELRSAIDLALLQI